MNASSSPGLAETYANVLDGFGLDRSDLDEPHVDEGPLTAETVLWDLELDDPDEAYHALQRALARSDRGIEAPRRYWSQAPAFQLGDVLAPDGYEVEFEGPGGGEFSAADDPFDVLLRSGETTERITFTYPEGSYGEDNYPALVHAVETRLLPREDLRFVLLDGHQDAWRFVLVEEADLEALREEYGHGIAVFGRPLLDEDQPADYVQRAGRVSPVDGADAARTGLIGGFDSVVAASGIDDAFESIEREAATEPVAPGPEPGPETAEAVDDVVPGTEVSTDPTPPAVREVSGDRLNEVVERFEADPTDVEDASARLRAATGEAAEPDGDVQEGASEAPDDGTEGTSPGTDASSRTDDGERSGEDGADLREEHIPSPGRPRNGLSRQVAQTLYSGGEDEAGEDGSARRSGDGGFVPAVDGDMSGARPADEETGHDPEDDPAGSGDDGRSADDATFLTDRERTADEGDGDPDPGVVLPDAEGDGDEPGRLERLRDTVRDLL